MYFLYNAQTYGACSVHTATTIYPVAGRPYEKIPFSPLYTDTIHFMEGTELYPTRGTLSAEDPPPNPPGSPLSKYDHSYANINHFISANYKSP